VYRRSLVCARSTFLLHFVSRASAAATWAGPFPSMLEMGVAGLKPNVFDFFFLSIFSVLHFNLSESACGAMFGNDILELELARACLVGLYGSGVVCVDVWCSH
jgi:hypothetical protein